MSSNELVHPDLAEILTGALSSWGPEVLRGYPVSGPPIAEIAEHFGLAPDEFMVTPGSDVALRNICAHYAARSGGAGTLVLQYPNYDAWEHHAGLLGLPVRRIVTEAADPEEQGARLVAAARETSGALIAVSVPNGPVGWVLSDRVLDELAAVSAERGHLLVVDSCYQAFAGPLTAQLRRAGGPVVVVQTLSKSHGLAGARVALTRGAPELIAELARGQLEQTVSGPSLAAARHVLAAHRDFERIWRDVRTAREKAARTLGGWGLTVLPSGGNFLTVRIGSAARAAAVTAALSTAGYRVRDLSGVATLEGCVRFTVGDEATCAALLAALREALAAAGTPGPAGARPAGAEPGAGAPAPAPVEPSAAEPAGVAS
ncbi:aminotransferase class I/II-fold pyridoxal phosphate-dependent enzyme [Streptomyces sp. URMC 123]|uniref:aminotransferase class I/II-fold pyridoxal phosphate-dependent enzyme n=1 Tax=Streptomyces sp. URMC 123 TaxID=3423403 RepID=UPI003F19A94C